MIILLKIYIKTEIHFEQKENYSLNRLIKNQTMLIENFNITEAKLFK